MAAVDWHLIAYVTGIALGFAVYKLFLEATKDAVRERLKALWEGRKARTEARRRARAMLRW